MSRSQNVKGREKKRIISDCRDIVMKFLFVSQDIKTKKSPS